MKTDYGFGGLKGFRRWYDYAYKHTHMITSEAKERLRILRYWRKHGLPATHDAFGIRRSTLYGWWKIYKESGWKEESLNPGSQARKNQNKRDINPMVLAEIKRLRLEVCPNMGKDKVKIFLDRCCKKEGLKTVSASTIGRIIKQKKIYYQRQKISHYGKVKALKRKKKLRKPEGFTATDIGDLVEIDTVVRFVAGIKRYIITAADIHTRYTFALGYERANSLSARDFFQKLEQVFPYRIRAVQTDNGSEFHKYFMAYLKERKITHYWNYPGRPYRNGHVEKYNRTIQDEFIDKNDYLLPDLKHFNAKLMAWLIWYNTMRPHWSLNLISPVDYLLKNTFLSKMSWTDTAP